jgi:hypothetical protein
MKRYIAAAVFAVILAFTSKNMNWFSSNQEAIAATSQVKNGSEYVIGRTEQILWGHTKLAIDIVTMLLVAYSLYGVFSTNKTKDETN